MKKFVGILLVLVFSFSAISAGAATMFALDGRSVWVPDYQVWEWRNVGWYTADDIYTQIVQPNYRAFKAKKDYLNLMYLVENYLPFMYGSAHEQSMYAIRTEAMDSWRVAINAPMGIASHRFKDGKLYVTVANISYKEVDYFEIECTGSGGRTTWLISCSENLGVSKFSEYVSGYLSGTSSISAPRVVKVVFTDGTQWKK